MSRLFASGNNLTLGGPSYYPLSPPFTLSIWLKRSAISATMHAMNIGVSGNTDNRYSLVGGSADVVQSHERDTTLTQALGSSTILQDTWQLYTGVFISHSSRAAFLNGGGKGTNTTTKAATPTNLIRISGDGNNNNSIIGRAAHAAIWDIDLSDGEVASLYTTDPRLIQSAHLVHYWPLTTNQSPEPDLGIRNESMVVTGATYDTDDPPPLNWIQEAGILLRVERGVVG